MRLRGTIGVCVLGLAAGLSGTMAFPQAAGAQSQVREFDPDLLRTGDLIRYRDLQIEDFRAGGPPREAGALHGQLGAATCVFLTTDPQTTIRASSDPTQPAGLVSAHVEGLAFIAYMDRRCSWWNPRELGLPDEYILQHEQIHFALFEVASRRLNARAEDLMLQMRMVSADQEGAIEELARRIDTEMQRMLDEVMARSNDFDRETSRTYRQDRQDWWYETVARELGRLAADAPAR
jgi:hypothetical protein